MKKKSTLGLSIIFSVLIAFNLFVHSGIEISHNVQINSNEINPCGDPPWA